MLNSRGVTSGETATGRSRGWSVPKWLSRAGLYAGAGVVLFLLGFVPMWLNARARSEERDAARRELRLARMENYLAASALEARHGDYEPARQEASDFFTALRRETDGTEDTALSPSQRDNLKPLLAGRDETITLLARGDPASAERLARLYIDYRGAVGEENGQGQGGARGR